MAHSYRNQPEPQKAAYSSYDHRYAPPSRENDSQYQTTTRGRSRAPSAAGADDTTQPSQQPLGKAIEHAFDDSEAARVVNPALIAQITEEVKKYVVDEVLLKMGVAQPAPVPPPPASTTAASVPPRDTPPSPKHAGPSKGASPSPDPLAHDPLLEDSDTPTPRHTKSDPIDIPVDKPSARPAAVPRMATEDYTPIEKMWQRLFDTDDQPLPRLGQFLRGLALHLVEDYEPKGSLVISPAKMLKFYEEVKLRDEIYPWQTLFGQLSYSALSKVYRDMRCQHHLIQEHPADLPYIPALTPQGFQEWMTVMIQAYPDAEYERLRKAVLAMPISNADDRRERFPKELPRRLFPQAENLQAQQRCAANLSAEGVAPLRKAPTFPPPPPKTQPPASSPTIERERSPYASQSETKVFGSEDDIEPSSVQIERERKPYAATPGGGKVYEDELQRSVTADATVHDQRRRRQSTAAQGPFPPPPSDTHHENSRHSRTSPQANGRRERSPTFSNPGTHSDPNMRDIPSSYYASNLHNIDDDARRYSKDVDGKTHDRHRRSTADSGYGVRSVYDDDDYRDRHGSNGYDNRGYESRRY